MALADGGPGSLTEATVFSDAGRFGCVDEGVRPSERRWLRLPAANATRGGLAGMTIPAAMVGYAVLAEWLCRNLGHSEDFRVGLYVVPFYASYLIYGLTLCAILALREYHGRTDRRLLWFRGGWTSRDFAKRLVSALPFLLAWPVFMAGFTAIKTLLNETVPFTWDTRLMSLGLALHFGRHAYQWLAIDSGWITRSLEMIYAFWGVLLVAIPFAVSLRRPGCPIRTRFLVSYLLVMVLLGNLAAACFMSAGPLWFEFGPTRHNAYQPLFNHLMEVDPGGGFSAIAFQRYLWQAHIRGMTDLGTGISAFPSVHGAVAALYALFAWQFGLPARIASLLFLAAIMVGSVHLGWHYALDGYAGCLGAAAIYFGVGWVQRLAARSRRFPDRTAQPAADGR